jgi:tRNA pseudouridine55 synthase
VRSLAADVGTALGGGAHLRRLRRTAVGRFTEDLAVPLDELGPDHVVPPASAVVHLASVAADGDMAEAVSYGRALDIDWPGEGPWAVLDGAGALLAVYERTDDGRIKPAVVVAPALPSGGSPPT